MKKHYKILTFFLICFCLANQALAEVKIENVAPVVIEDIASKTRIDSKIDISSAQVYDESKPNKSNLNNFAIGASIGKKFETKKFQFSSSKLENFFDDKLILSELFFNKNIIKNSSKNNLNIDSLCGFRAGFGKDFGNVHLILNSAISSLNTTSLNGKSNRNLLFVSGFTLGYELNKNFDIRFNIMTSIFKKTSDLKRNFNNFDVSIAFNF